MSTMVNIGGDRSPERARQDYIKGIYQLGERKAVRAADLARSLGVSRASVSKFKRMLEQEKLLEHSVARNDALRLTKKGKALAVRMVRRHRLVETFLYRTLQMPLDRVHSEAERIEHAISDDVSARLATFLAYPVADPHGHRIPAGIRKTPVADDVLARAKIGERVTVTSIDDRDARVVRELSAHGVLPGQCVTVIGRRQDGLRVRVGRDEIGLSRRAVDGIRCARGKRERPTR